MNWGLVSSSTNQAIMKQVIIKIASFTIYLICGLSQLYGQTDKRTVEEDFNRCLGMLKRSERSIKQLEDAISSLKQETDVKKNKSLFQENAELENKLEYFRSRLERAQNLSEKNSEDLKNVKGPLCPSCIESSVKLFCRSVESLQDNIDEYIEKTDVLRFRIVRQLEPHPRDNAFISKYKSLDSAYQAFTLDYQMCNNKVTDVLVEQSKVNLHRAESLYTANDHIAADKTLDIVQTLLEKAINVCSGK